MNEYKLIVNQILFFVDKVESVECPLCKKDIPRPLRTNEFNFYPQNEKDDERYQMCDECALRITVFIHNTWFERKAPEEFIYTIKYQLIRTSNCQRFSDQLNLRTCYIVPSEILTTAIIAKSIEEAEKKLRESWPGFQIVEMNYEIISTKST